MDGQIHIVQKLFLFRDVKCSHNNSNEVYVVIWFSEDKCAIIKLEVTHISAKFRMKDFKSIYWVKSYIDGKQVNTEYERTWRITSKKTSGSFIDKNVSSGLF